MNQKHTFMIFDFGILVKEYAARGKKNQFPKKMECPHCHRIDKVIWYGFYSRWCQQVIIVIKRYFCKHCSKTFRLLPSFLCQGIGETLEVVESILWNISQGKSYKESRESISRKDLCYQRLQYWRKRWQRKSLRIRATLPLKEMPKSLDIFGHLSAFFDLAQDSGQLFEAVNSYFSRTFYEALL